MPIADAIAALPRRGPGALTVHTRAWGVRATLLCGLRAWKAYAQRSFAGWARERCTHAAFFAAAVASFALGLQVLTSVPAGAQGASEDEELPEVFFTLDTDEVYEGQREEITIIATVDSPVSEELRIAFEIGAISDKANLATLATDYNFGAGIGSPPLENKIVYLTIPATNVANTGMATFTIVALPNPEPEPDEIIEVGLSGAGASYVLQDDHPATRNITIIDNDSSVLIEPVNSVIAEGEPAEFTVTVVGDPPMSDLNVHWEVDVAGPAHPAGPEDYTLPTSSSLVISAGTISGSIHIDTEDDNYVERTETLRVKLTRAETPDGNPYRFFLENNADIDITSDDMPPTELTIRIDPHPHVNVSNIPIQHLRLGQQISVIGTFVGGTSVYENDWVGDVTIDDDALRAAGLIELIGSDLLPVGGRFRIPKNQRFGSETFAVRPSHRRFSPDTPSSETAEVSVNFEAPSGSTLPTFLENPPSDTLTINYDETFPTVVDLVASYIPHPLPLRESDGPTRVTLTASFDDPQTTETLRDLDVTIPLAFSGAEGAYRITTKDSAGECTGTELTAPLIEVTILRGDSSGHVEFCLDPQEIPGANSDNVLTILPAEGFDVYPILAVDSDTITIEHTTRVLGAPPTGVRFHVSHNPATNRDLDSVSEGGDVVLGYLTVSVIPQTAGLQNDVTIPLVFSGLDTAGVVFTHHEDGAHPCPNDPTGDPVPPSSVVISNSGEGSYPICLWTTDDDVFEDDRELVISSPAVPVPRGFDDSYSVIPWTITILDDDAPTPPTGIELSVEDPLSRTIPEHAGPTPVTLRATPTGPGSPRFSEEEVITLDRFRFEGNPNPDERYEFTQFDGMGCLPLDHESSADAPDTITIGAEQPYGEVSFCLDPDDETTSNLDRVLIIDANDAYKTRKGSSFDVEPARLTILDDDDAPTGVRYRLKERGVAGATGQERFSVTEGDAPANITVTAELMCDGDVCEAGDPTFPFDIVLQVEDYTPPSGFELSAAEASDYIDNPQVLPINIREGEHSGEFHMLFTTIQNVTTLPERDEAVAYAAHFGGGEVRIASDGSVLDSSDTTTPVAFTLNQQPAYVIIEDEDPEIMLSLSRRGVEEGEEEIPGSGTLGVNITLTASFPTGTTFETTNDVRLKIQARSPRNPPEDSVNGLDYALNSLHSVRDWRVCGVNFQEIYGGADQITDFNNPLIISTTGGARRNTLNFCIEVFEDNLHEGEETVTFSAFSESGLNLDMSGRFTVRADTLTITDADTPPAGPIALSVHAPVSAQVNEDATGGVPVTIEARFPPGATVLSEDLTLTVTLEQGIADGEARHGAGACPGAAQQDYVSVPAQTITIPAGHRGARSSPFTLTPCDDNVVEGGETIPITGVVQTAAYAGIDVTGPALPLTLADDDDPPTIIALRLRRPGTPLEDAVPELFALEGGSVEYTLSAHFVDGGDSVLEENVTLQLHPRIPPSIPGGGVEALTISAGSREASFPGTEFIASPDDRDAGDRVIEPRRVLEGDPIRADYMIEPARIVFRDNDTNITLTTVDTNTRVPEGTVEKVTVRARIGSVTSSSLTTPIDVPIVFRPNPRASRPYPAHSPADYIVTLPVDGSCPDETTETSTHSPLAVTIDPEKTDGRAVFCFRAKNDDEVEITETVDIFFPGHPLPDPIGRVVTDTGNYPVNYTVVSDNSTRLRILDSVVVSLRRSGAASSIREDEGPAEFEVWLNQPASFPIDVTWSISGDVTQGDDYVTLSETERTLTIPAGSGTDSNPAILSITLIDDDVLENPERLEVTLDIISEGDDGTPRKGASDSADLTIRDNDVPNVRVRGVEVDEDKGPAQVTLELVYPRPGITRNDIISFGWGTRSDSALGNDATPGDSCDTPGVDYVEVPVRTVNFPVDGAETRQVPVEICDDTVSSTDDPASEAVRETFRVFLSDQGSPLVDIRPPGGGGRSMGTITIIDNDYERPAITLEVTTGESGASVREEVIPNVQSVSVRASFTDPTATPPPLPVDITLYLRDVTATLGTDYSFDAAALPTLTINSPGSRSNYVTFDITIEDDTLIEGDETVEVHGTAEGYIISHDTLEIEDDEMDHDSIVLSTIPSELVEGVGNVEGSPGANHVTLIATLRGGMGVLTHNVEIPLERFDINWTPAGDRLSPPLSSTVTIPFGQEKIESPEYYIITLARDDHFLSDRGVLIRAASTYDYADRYPIDDLTLRIRDASDPPTGITLSVVPDDSIAEDADSTELTLQARFNSPSLFSYDVEFPVSFSPEVVVTQRVGGVCTGASRDPEAQPVTVTIPKNVRNPIGRSVPFCLRAVDDNVVEGERTLTISADPVMAQPGLDISEYPVESAMLTITEDDEPPTAITLSVNPTAIPEAGGGPVDVMLRARFDGPSALAGPTDLPVVFPNHEAVKAKVARKADGGVCPSAAPESSAAGVTVTIEGRSLEGTAPLCVWPEDDRVFSEGGRTLNIDITDPGVTIRYDVTATTLTITDDESAPTRIVLDVQPGEIVEGQLGPHTIAGESGFSEFTLTAGFETGSSLLPTSLPIPLDTAFRYWTPEGNLDVPLGDIAGAFPVPMVTILAGMPSGSVRFYRMLDENDVFLPEVEERIFASSGYTGPYPVIPETLMLRFNNLQPTGVTLRVMSDTISERDGISEVMLTATLGGLSTLPYAMKIPVSFSELAAAGIEELGNRVGDSCVASPVTVTIPPMSGVSSAVPLCVKPLQDDRVTPNRVLTISAPDQPAPPGFSPYRVASDTLTITEADAPPDGVTFEIMPKEVAEGVVLVSGAETITVTATLTGGSGTFPDAVTPVAVVYGVTANGGSDYALDTPDPDGPFVPITIPAGMRTGTNTFTISPTQDFIVEGDETVRVGFEGERTDTIFSSGVPYTLTDTSDTPNNTLTIVDDDMRPDEIRITLDPDEVHEGDGLQPVRVRAEFPDDDDAVLFENLTVLPEDVTVRLALGGDTRDYSAIAVESGDTCGETSGPAPGSGPTIFNVVIPQGTRGGERYLCFTPVPDNIVEQDEVIPITGRVTTEGYADIAVTRADLTLLDDDRENPGGVELKVEPVTLPEDNAGAEQTTTLRVTATLTGGLHYSQDLVIYPEVSNGAGEVLSPSSEDPRVSHRPRERRLPHEFNSGRPTTFTIDVTPRPDNIVEEDVPLTITARVCILFSCSPDRPTSMTTELTVNSVVVNIEDNDEALITLEGPAGPVEEGEAAEFTVRLSNPVAGAVAVAWSTSDGSAVAGEGDYEEERAGSVEFPESLSAPAQETLSVRTLPDGLSENEEHFDVSLGRVTSAYGERVRTSDGEATAQAVIAANGLITVLLESPSDAGVPEGTYAVFRVSLRPEGIIPPVPIHLDYTTRDGTAEAGRDYTAAAGTLSFTEDDATPQEVRVMTLDNNLYDGEGERSFTLFMNDIRGGGDGRNVTGSAPLTEGEGGYAAPALILDDETPPELHLLANPGEISEAAAGTPRGISTLSVEVRGSAFVEARTVALSFGGNALLGEDYRVSGDSIEVPAGTLGVANTVQVEVLDDDIDDDDEWILVSARVLEEEIEVLGEARQILIHDDDDPWVTVSFTEAFVEIPEGRSRTITARLDAPPEREVVIPLDALNEGGAGREDYEGVPAALVFGAEDTEQHFTLRVLRDRVEPESGEGVQIVIAQPLPERVLLGEPPSVSVSFVELPFGEDVQQAFKYALASFGRSVAMSTLDVIEDRFEITDDRPGSSYLAVDGMRVPLGALRRLPRGRKARGGGGRLAPALREVAGVVGVRIPRAAREASDLSTDGAGRHAPARNVSERMPATGSIDGGYGSGGFDSSSFAPGGWSAAGGGGLGPFSSFESEAWSGNVGAGGTNFAGAASASTSTRNRDARNIGRGGGEPDMRVRIEPPEAKDLLSRSSFSLTPSAADTVPVDSAWTVWGRSDVRSFDGNPGGNFDLDATTFSGHIGVDYRRSKNLLTGLSLSHTVSDMSYVDASRDNSRGEFRAHLTALNHYSHWSYSENLDLYVVMGEGFGIAEIEEYGKRAKTDINMHTSILGARRGLQRLGAVALAAKADAFLVEVESDALPDISLPKITSHAMRMRAMLEGSTQSTTRGGARLNNKFEMGILLDAGDADRGEGMEFGTEFHYIDDMAGVELSGRWMLAYASGGYQEWGAAVTLNLDPGAPGRGVRLSLAPDWGAPASGGVAALWRGADLSTGRDAGCGRSCQLGDGHEPGRGNGGRRRSAAPEQVKMELAYGVGIQGGTFGRVEPFGTWFFEDSGAWNMRLGVRMELSRFARSETGEDLWLLNSLQMEFFNERHTFLYREDEHRIGIKLNAGF